MFACQMSRKQILRAELEWSGHVSFLLVILLLGFVSSYLELVKVNWK